MRSSSRVGRWALLVLGLSILAAAGLGWAYLPQWAEERAAIAIKRAGQAFDLDIQYQSLTIDGLHRIQLTGVTLSPRDALPQEVPLASIPSVELGVEVTSWLAPRVRLNTVALQAPEVALVRRQDGTDNFGGLVDRLQSLLGRGDRQADSRREVRLPALLERHLPLFTVSGGRVQVSDRSPQRRLIPPIAGLPETLIFPDLRLRAENQSGRMARLQLECEADAAVPLLGSHLHATLHVDGGSGRVTAGIQLTTPAHYRVGGVELRVARAEWFVGGPLRLHMVAVDALATASELVIWPREVASGIPKGAVSLDALLGQIRKIVIERPVVTPAAARRVGGWLTPAKSMTVSNAPLTALRPTGLPRKRPKQKKAGGRVRAALSQLFLDARGQVRRWAGAWTALGRRVPAFDVAVNNGRLGLAVAGAPPLMRFDVSLSHPGLDMLEGTLSLSDGDTPESTVSARLHLGTGDLQVRVQAAALALAPLRDWLPARLLTTDASAVQDTDLRILYSAAEGRLEVHGPWALKDVGMAFDAIAPRPMRGMRLGGTLHAVFELDGAALTLTETTLGFGEAVANVTLTARDLGGAALLDWSLELPKTPAQRVVDALPSAVLGRLDGLKVTGDVAWKHVGHLDTRDMATLTVKGRPKTWTLGVTSLGQIDISKVLKPFKQRSPGAKGKVFTFQTGPGSHNWVPLSRISPWMGKVLTTTEDGTFWHHKGVAIFAIEDALRDNLEKGRFYRGASTLTQQLVKNLFLVRDKTLARKAQELFLAWRLEAFLSKERILELYLNIVELGPGIYGVKRAAKHYFGKSAADLDLVESVFLASILPNPRKYYYLYRRGHITENWRKGLERIIAVMQKRGRVTAAEVRAAAPYEPVFRTRHRPR